MKVLNGIGKDIESYSNKSDVDRLSSTIHYEIMPILKRMESMHEDVIEELISIKKDILEMKERNIKQDTILTIVKKIPYFFFITAGLTLMVSNKNFSFTDWFIKEAKQVVHYEV